MQLNRIFATLAIVAGVAAMSAPVYAGNHSGSMGSSHRQTEHGNNGGNVERDGSGGHEREAAGREHDADGEGASRGMSGTTGSAPAATPLSKLGSTPASTLKTVPVSAMGSAMVGVPASSLSTVSLSTLPSAPAPAPVAAAPTPAPAIDGAALYNSLCAGCHGSGKRGRPAASTQAAINGNLGGMGSLSYLTPAQLQAISAY